MVSFEFKHSYPSIEALRADMRDKGQNISVWKYYGEVIVNKVEGDDVIVFNLFEDGHLEFDHIEEFSFI